MPKGRLPSTVINQDFGVGTGIAREFPRYTGIVGPALPLKLFLNEPLVRGQYDARQLFFSGVTYQAPLGVDVAIPDRQRSRLYTGDGRTVSTTKWNFIESSPGVSGHDTVQIDPDVFDSMQTYFLDYVTSNEAYLDQVLVADIREITAVGDNANQVRYQESLDFRFITAVTGPSPGTGNTNPTGSVVTPIVPGAGNTGTGTVAHNSNTYTHGYNRAYVANVVATAGVAPNRTATIEVSAYQTSSGFGTEVGLSSTTGNLLTLNLDETVPASLTDVAIENGITVDFAFGGTNFAVNDVFTFGGNGPGALELSDAMVNTNERSQVGAVVPTATGEGEVTINPQTDFSGSRNRPYTLVCTATAGVGATRTADFRWRTTADLLTPDGTFGVTNASATVTGVGTTFTADLAPNDILFVGADAVPVTILTVDNDTQVTLTAPYGGATISGVKALRSRDNTGTFTVDVNAPTRVTLDRGILLDFDFGPLAADNFDVNDTFEFQALTARTQYNGKENRTYEIDATATGDHVLTVSYSGDTVSAGFGTHTFSEGNPLILANNTNLNAINMTLDNRFNAVAPADEFSLSLTFTGQIDWTLTRRSTETIPSSSILRDLSGNVTGTAGAYYIQTKKVPTAVNYVAGPSPSFTNYTFSQVPDTNVIFFTTNPGVNLTVSYDWKGPEPRAGATYFLSGYQKRPDSDYNKPQLFTTEEAASTFLSPMTPENYAAIANQIAWAQDKTSLPGVVIFLVKDSDEDGIYTETDYNNAIEVAEQFKGTMDICVVNSFASREEFRDSTVNMNDPGVARHRIAYFGFPVNYPIGDEFTPDSRIYVTRQELQVFEESPARGTLTAIANSFCKLTIQVNAVGTSGSTIGTTAQEVTLDGSFLAVALAARMSSFNEPWNSVLNLPVSGFTEIEELTESEMIQCLDAGMIPVRVEGGSGFYQGTVTTDETEPSTQQLSGTAQRQYVLARLKNRLDSAVIGQVPRSPEEAAQALKGETVAELAAMVSEGKVGNYIDPDTGVSRPIDPTVDVTAVRDRNDPTQMYFRASWYQRYPILFVDGLVAVDQPTPT